MNRVAIASLVTSKFVAQAHQYMTGHLLDVGCGSMPYKRLFLGNPACGVRDWTGIDCRPVGDKQMDAHKLDFPDESFDTVLCTNMLNYCISPLVVVGECARVLKKGGHLVVSAFDTYEDDEEMLWGVRLSGLGESLLAADLNILDITKYGGLMNEEVTNLKQHDKYGFSAPPEIESWTAEMDEAYPLLIAAIARKE